MNCFIQSYLSCIIKATPSCYGLYGLSGFFLFVSGGMYKKCPTRQYGRQHLYILLSYVSRFRDFIAFIALSRKVHSKLGDYTNLSCCTLIRLRYIPNWKYHFKYVYFDTESYITWKCEG